ncbi:MAG TPA: FlgD immunoglobulin-like domain containing protein [Candidatus Krumholzibacteria bacterium]|nr:FlgD immunoglobulin-like domain containing protein [Candidatus Krumholzibacteria bacterium]
MKRAMPLLALLLFISTSHSSQARQLRDGIQQSQSSPVQPAKSSGPNAPQAPATVVQSWTFDNGGAPDPQGWTSVDMTDQPAYFHVEDFTGFLPPIPPLSGTKSMWCGRRACNSPTDCELYTDGYGNDWEQYFFSQPFTVSGDVTITFQLRYDCESSYDNLELYYAKSDQVPHLLDTWSGTGTLAVNKLIPAADHDGTISFLFKFKSDNAVSDEDGFIDSEGAATIDDILIFSTGSGLVDSQTFETSAEGDTHTPDFHWFASGPAAVFGDYSALFDGTTVLQEDPAYQDATHLWGFFSGSPDTYACGGHPEQLAVPLTQNVDGILRGINNELRSPPVSLAAFPAGHAVVLSFDVYEDLALPLDMYYSYGVRSKVGGVWQPWKRSGVAYYNAAKAWNVRTLNLNPLIVAGATDIQLSMIARDLCPYTCSPGSPTTCHSQGPLIDNVRLIDGNTTTGYLVDVTPVDWTTGTSPVSLNFFQVTNSGETSLVTSSTGPAPSGFTIGDGTYYSLSTTASYSGAITICIHYDEASLTVPEASLTLEHWDTDLNPDAWVDITSSLDTVNNIICGTTTHFSPFALGGPAATAVGDGAMPRGFALHQNVPNPFNPATTIAYDVPAGGAKVSIRVYDTTGHLVRTLVDGQRPAGTQTAQWDGRNEFGAPVSSGVYFYKMVAGSFVESKRMVLLK